MNYLFFLFLFILIHSTNYEVNKINPNIFQKIPVYSRVDSFIYFESNFLSTNDIYLYLEDRAYYKSKFDICYTNDEPLLSSTIPLGCAILCCHKEKQLRIAILILYLLIK